VRSPETNLYEGLRDQEIGLQNRQIATVQNWIKLQLHIKSGIHSDVEVDVALKDVGQVYGIQLLRVPVAVKC
jgi:hypothetical protein